MSSSADGTMTPVGKTAPPNIEDFTCSICMDLLYKPCVNACGHSFCFWCFHRAMDVLCTRHHCPLCRAEFRHFPAVCIPLYRYIAHAFPTDIASRAEQTKKLEREEYNVESPSIEEQPSGGEAASLFVLRDELKCMNCERLACPPTVLSCGHVVCYCSSSQQQKSKSSSSSREKLLKCPVKNCVGIRSTDGAPAVCHLLDKVLRENLSPDEYADAALESKRQCCGLLLNKQQSHAVRKEEQPLLEASGDDSSPEHHLAPDAIVVFSGLTSQAGARLNGKKATIQSYDASTGRYTVRLLSSAPLSDMHPGIFNIKRENLIRSSLHDESILSKEETYVHYGVGCDGCGVYPITGRRYKCDDCSEEIGFDLCGDCYDAGVVVRNKRSDDTIIGGRFNQQHRPDHKMLEIGQEVTLLHQLQQMNPDIPLPTLLDMLGMEMAPSAAAATSFDEPEQQHQT